LRPRTGHERITCRSHPAIDRVSEITGGCKAFVSDDPNRFSGLGVDECVFDFFQDIEALKAGADTSHFAFALGYPASSASISAEFERLT
jgi:hypothetical protein